MNPTRHHPFLWLCIWAFASALIYATPPADPICGNPSSLDLVNALRAQMTLKSNPAPSFRQQVATPPQLSIQRPTTSNLPLLNLGGAAGQTYHLDALFSLAAPQWKPWLSVTLGDQPLTWSHDSMLGQPFQFFRLRSTGPAEQPDFSSNFRLLDQRGVARDLYYHTHLDGIAVLSAGRDLNNITPLLPILKSLAAAYADKLQIWILLSDPSPVRSNVLAQASTLEIDFPVLFDQHNLAARSVGLTKAGEVALVQPPTYNIVYRGEVKKPDDSDPSNSYLGRALASLNGASLTFHRTPVSGTDLISDSGEIPSYSREVAPIFHQYCATCHRPGGVAPFALTNHSVAELWAPTMKHALLSGIMPPWHADPEYGKFANDLSIPGELKSKLIRWIDAGARRGDGPDPLADLPSPPAYEEWPPELGEPDAVVSIPLQQIKATGSEPYRYIFVQTPNPSNVWLRAAIIRPSNYRAVHHYLVWLGRVGNGGFGDFSTYQSHIAEFVPGYKPRQLPADSYISLTQSNWVTFNLHYTPYGVATNDQPTLALWYHKTKPPKAWHANPIANITFAIPPGAANHQVQAEWAIQSPVTIHRFNPHMHVRGKRMKYELVQPNGSRETLLSVPDYDFNWQLGYELAQPRSIPAGSRIIVTGAFDNSPQNLANPDPNATVGWGDQSWMEMFIGYIDYTQ